MFSSSLLKFRESYNFKIQMSKLLLYIFSIAIAIDQAFGHGMMLDPPNRSSLWRFNKSFPINYNDNENFCGGFAVQWGTHGGKCGVCGDNFGDAVPRPNENTGKYGLGYVVEEYKAGSVIDVLILLTANHKGWFSYGLCDLEDASQPEKDDCFEDLIFEDGSREFVVQTGINYFDNRVRLPPGKTCKRCVLRWHYKAGNNWGQCGNGTGAIGCGDQETFRSCSDIAIV